MAAGFHELKIVDVTSLSASSCLIGARKYHSFAPVIIPEHFISCIEIVAENKKCLIISKTLHRIRIIIDSQTGMVASVIITQPQMNSTEIILGVFILHPHIPLHLIKAVGEIFERLEVPRHVPITST